MFHYVYQENKEKIPDGNEKTAKILQKLSSVRGFRSFSHFPLCLEHFPFIARGFTRMRRIHADYLPSPRSPKGFNPNNPRNYLGRENAGCTYDNPEGVEGSVNYFKLLIISQKFISIRSRYFKSNRISSYFIFLN